jgi:uncharacterized phiE125 gp8 family phage protein
VAPTQTPVSLDEAKAHLRVDHPDDDATVAAMIKAATSAAEQFLRRSLCTQTLRLALREFPVGAIELPRPPVQAITAISYLGIAGGLWATILNIDDGRIYEFDQHANAVVLLPNKSWPSTVTYRTSVTIDYVAGYASPAAIPDAIRQAILMTVGHFFANREDVVTGTIATALPRSAESLLWPFRHMAIV